MEKVFVVLSKNGIFLGVDSNKKGALKLKKTFCEIHPECIGGITVKEIQIKEMYFGTIRIM